MRRRRYVPPLLRPKLSRVAIVWIQEGDYERMQALLGYPKELPLDYSRWLDKTKLHERELKQRKRAVFAVRVTIHPDKFVRYCKDQSKAATMDTLSSFAYSHLYPPREEEKRRA